MRAVDQHIGIRMRLRREELGMSREFLAGEIEQPIERLISYENGWIRVEPAILLRLSISLKLSLAGFFADLEPSSACTEAAKRSIAVSSSRSSVRLYRKPGSRPGTYQEWSYRSPRA
jgi:transcriptional regulator with XRE-family HTH domain